MGEVYQPAEDSIFLLQTVETMQEARVAEVGVGSGFIIGEYARANLPDIAVGTDTNLGALKKASMRNGAGAIEYVLCLSCEAFREASFRLIFFNPPYLKSEGTFDLATSGGLRGFERTLEIAGSSYRALSGGGRLVFLVSSLASPRMLLIRLRKKGMKTVRLGSLRLFFEVLYSYEATKPTSRKPL
jgi:methylase of polypeptide subunit release factors